jgi:23S rRNA pseudouridine1911/1915/1917 synthase
VSAPDVRSLVVPAELAGLRLDVALARLAPDLTRSRIQRLVEGGRVLVAGRLAKAAVRLHGGEAVLVELEPPAPTAALAQDLPLTVLHEDQDLVVLDKAAGMVVHPARGTPHSTVLNALLHRLGEGGALPRVGLVHRLDKDTSGCLVVARTDAALQALQAQWKGRTVEKVYVAVCHGALGDAGHLDTPYGRHPKDRTRYTGRLRDSPRRAVTDYRALERFGDAATLAEVTLHTGRTHQIRVHLSEAGHPLLGDALYGGTRREGRDPGGLAARASRAIGRQALHAARLAFDHPRTGKRVCFEAALPVDLERGLRVLREGR